MTDATQPLPTKPSPSLVALEELFLSNTTLRFRLAALRALAERAQTGSDLERQLAASMLCNLALKPLDEPGEVAATLVGELKATVAKKTKRLKLDGPDGIDEAAWDRAMDGDE